MALSSDLISQFVKITKDKQETKKDTIVYGTIQQIDDDDNYVKIDGSDISTPVKKTVVASYNKETGEGDRVMVTIKDHTAIVTNNLSNPSARVIDTVSIDKLNASNARIDEIESAYIDTAYLQSNYITAKEIDAKYAKLDELDTRYITVEDLEAQYAKISRLEVSEGKITTLEATTADISGRVTANEAAIKDLQAEHIDTETLNATYATVRNLDATNAEINTLKSTKADILDLDAALGRIDTLESNSITTAYLQSNYITANEIESTYVTATKLAAEYAKTTTLESDYAKINLANVEIADIGTVLANAGLITSATIVDGHVTGYLDSVQINANDITTGTLTVDRLVISGTDKSIVYALNNAGDLTSTEVDTINGDILTKRTIAADHIIAGAITANELHSESVTSDKIASKAVTAGKINVTSLESIVAKIGSFNINNSLYSNNHSAYNTANNGVYIGSDYISLGNGGKTWLKNDGSVSIGNGAISYDATNGVLDINASSIKMASQTLALKTDVDNIEIGGRNIMLNSSFKGVSNNQNISFDSINRTLTCVSSEFGQTYMFVRSLSNYGLKKLRGKTITMSGEYRVESDLSYGPTNTWLGMELGINRNSTTGGDSQWLEWLGSNPKINKVASDKWTKFSQTHDVTDFDASSYSNITIIFRDFIGAIKFRNLKVEFGNKATDWTPAPEDVESDILDASKTATNYLNFTSNGLVIGDLTSSSLGKNVLIDSSSVKIRTGTTENAVFGADIIELAKDNESATISMLNGAFKIYYDADNSDGGFGIYGVTSTGEERLAFQPVNENDNLTIGWGGYNAKANCTNIYGHNMNLIAGNDMAIECEDWKINIDGNLFAKASNGSFLELIGLSSDNNTAIGHGGYTSALGKTNIYGNKIQHIVNTTSGSTSYKPYYEAGDSFETEWYGAGFISSSSKIVYFSIPLAKPVIGNKTPTVIVTNGTNSGGLQVRQNNNYVFGSTSSAKTSPASYSAKVVGDGNFVQIEATMSNTTNAINNDVCGINASIKITFS